MKDDDDPERIVYVQTLLFVRERDKLMEKSGKSSMKEALRAAVLAYIKG